jgi:hypothetical protein
MRSVLLLLLVLVTVLPASAQLADSLCTYDACALRYEPRLFGRDLVRGAGGVPVDARLSDAVAMSPRALEFAREYERTRTPALLTLLGSSLLLAFATPPPGDELIPLSDGARLGLLAGGTGLGIVGLRLSLRSQRARSRAIWHYNRSLAR